jgi:hypothetical protein
VKVNHKFFASYFSHDEVRHKRVGVVGREYVAVSKKQQKKQPDVIFRIKKKALLEEARHPFSVVISFVRIALSAFSANNQNIKPVLVQRRSHLMHPLIRFQIVSHRQYYFFLFHDTNIIDIFYFCKKHQKTLYLMCVLDAVLEMTF